MVRSFPRCNGTCPTWSLASRNCWRIITLKVVNLEAIEYYLLAAKRATAAMNNEGSDRISEAWDEITRATSSLGSTAWPDFVNS